MTLKEYYKIHDKEIGRLIRSALAEDRIKYDAATNLLFKNSEGSRITKAELLCKEDCVLAGIEIFKRVFREIDPNVKFSGNAKDGMTLRNKTKVLEVKASLKTLLTGERTALNFIQRMSGIATLTNKFVGMLKYPESKILHTRKTTPNFRVFEIAAVKTGGGDFHRQDLSSAVMIKDNHIEAVGNLEKVLLKLGKMRLNNRKKERFEIEVKNFKEIEILLKLGKGIVKIVMLDNFKPQNIDKAIGILKQSGFKIEISGGVNLSNFSKFQRKGIDFYSSGALTHSYKSADFALNFCKKSAKLN